MAKLETMHVKFKSGKFKGEVMRINADDFNSAVHEECTKAEPKKAEPKKGKGK